MSLKMSDTARRAVRKAITSHPMWPAYRAKRGIDGSSLTTSEIEAAVTHFGIDVWTIIAEADRAVVLPLTGDDDGAPKALPKTILTPTTITTRPLVIDNEPAPMPAPAPAVPPSDAAAKLQDAIQALMGSVTAPIDRAQVEEIARAAVQDEIKRTPGLKITFERDGRKVGEIAGIQHPKMQTLARVLASRQPDGYVPNVWLSGPAGSGKSTAPLRLADAMGLPFHFSGAVDMEHKLTGFVDAAGNYHRTPFREAFENGGYFVFDEVDASDPGAVMSFQAALANGRFAFPDGQQVIRHPDCIIIATANTWGLGANSDYVGRNKLDAAFLSRFPVRIDWPIDGALEVALAGNQVAWAVRVQEARRKAAAAGIKVLICPRMTIAGAALCAAGFSEDEAAELTYLAALTPDQRRLIEA